MLIISSVQLSRSWEIFETFHDLQYSHLNPLDQKITNPQLYFYHQHRSKIYQSHLYHSHHLIDAKI